jgi:valyl-tRNA synthetase
MKARLLHAAYADAEPTIMLASYPEADANLIDEEAETAMQVVIELVSRVRNIRSEMEIKPSQEIQIIVRTSDQKLNDIFENNSAQIMRLTRASKLKYARRVDSPLEIPRASARAVLAGGAEVAVPLEGLIDFDQEKQRLGKEKEKLAIEASKLIAQLANPQFAERAPAEKVDEIRARIADIAQRTVQLDQTIANLQ